MSPASGNKHSFPAAAEKALKMGAVIPDYDNVVVELEKKRPADEGPEQAAYDAALDTLRSALNKLDRLTATMCAIVVRTSDTTFRKAAGKAKPGALDAREDDLFEAEITPFLQDRNERRTSNKSIKTKKGTTGSTTSAYTYDRLKVIEFWKNRQAKMAARRKARKEAGRDPIDTVRQVTNADDAANLKLRAVQYQGKVVYILVDASQTANDLLAMFRKGAIPIRVTLDQALRMGWHSTELRARWRNVWKQAMEHTIDHTLAVFDQAQLVAQMNESAKAPVPTKRR